MKAHPLFPYFFEKRLAIPKSPFFHLLVNGFSVIYIYIFIPYRLSNSGGLSVIYPCFSADIPLF